MTVHEGDALTRGPKSLPETPQRHVPAVRAHFVSFVL
ncbi:hypothetical protein C8N42_109110 [Celeribacter persicus]|uniref:Uncharacterized protein n=1 Tax=Celeribacter persicus TaxID=1651082 RepID=A0A2T5HGT1_9RHOB|nr:hypothetical protein C8N42_109110 [Celeribacter persicus]